MEAFKGYGRADGRVGIRNHVAVVSTVSCANGVVDKICAEIPETVKIIHANGCGRGGEDLRIHSRTLQNLCKNPNFASILVVGLGCEIIPVDSLNKAAASVRKPAERLTIQAEGGSEQAIKKGIEIANKLVEEAKKIEPGIFPFSQLAIGLKCGGSDAFSGLSANSAIGFSSDWIVDQGGSALLTEVEELNGTGHILRKRAVNEDIAKRIETVILRTKKEAEEILGDIAKIMITPGNMKGGMTTIVEKSLGSAVKGGTRPISDVIEYADTPKKNGLMIMDGPGYDPEAMAGLAAAGCQLILFSTGRGTPLGFPGVPVVKISSNNRLYDHFKGDIDINTGTILDGTRTIEEVGTDLVDLIKNTADGMQTKAELNKQDGILCMYNRYRSF